MKRHLKITILALIVAALLSAAPALGADGLIQPGDRMYSTDAACTLNFVFDGEAHLAGRVYMGTAAHCVSHYGEAIFNNSGEQFGTVALIGNPDETNDDYAFIEVLPQFVGRVSAQVKGSPWSPTGAVHPDETYSGDLVQLSGYGDGFSLTRPTQEWRMAVLTWDDYNSHGVAGPLIFGDSGGPLVHVATGKALGIVSSLCLGACTEIGPSIHGIMWRVHSRGFPLRLRTV